VFSSLKFLGVLLLLLLLLFDVVTLVEAMLSLVVGVYIEDVIYKSFSILYYIHFLKKSVAKTTNLLGKGLDQNYTF
jgi:hypothetical protein